MEFNRILILLCFVIYTKASAVLSLNSQCLEQNKIFLSKYDISFTLNLNELPTSPINITFVEHSDLFEVEPKYIYFENGSYPLVTSQNETVYISYGENYNYSQAFTVTALSTKGSAYLDFAIDTQARDLQLDDSIRQPLEMTATSSNMSETNVFLIISIVLFMFTFGLSLSGNTLKGLYKRERLQPIFCGFICQFIITPLFAFIITRLFKLSDYISLGVIMVSASPGSAFAPIFTYYLGGDRALAVGLCLIATICGTFTFPIIIYLFCLVSNISIETFVPLRETLYFSGTQLIPLGVGCLVLHFKPQWASWLKKAGPIWALAIIITSLITSLSNYGNILINRWDVYCMPLLLGAISYFVGFTIPRIFGLDTKQVRAICFNTGLQNSPLALTIIQVLGTPSCAQLISLIPLHQTFWMIVEGLIIGIVMFFFFPIVKPIMENSEQPINAIKPEENKAILQEYNNEFINANTSLNENNDNDNDSLPSLDNVSVVDISDASIYEMEKFSPINPTLDTHPPSPSSIKEEKVIDMNVIENEDSIPNSINLNSRPIQHSNTALSNHNKSFQSSHHSSHDNEDTYHQISHSFSKNSSSAVVVSSINRDNSKNQTTKINRKNSSSQIIVTEQNHHNLTRNESTKTLFSKYRKSLINVSSVVNSFIIDFFGKHNESDEKKVNMMEKNSSNKIYKENTNNNNSNKSKSSLESTKEQLSSPVLNNNEMTTVTTNTLSKRISLNRESTEEFLDCDNESTTTDNKDDGYQIQFEKFNQENFRSINRLELKQNNNYNNGIQRSIINNSLKKIKKNKDFNGSGSLDISTMEVEASKYTKDYSIVNIRNEEGHDYSCNRVETQEMETLQSNYYSLSTNNQVNIEKRFTIDLNLNVTNSTTTTMTTTTKFSREFDSTKNETFTINKKAVDVKKDSYYEKSTLTEKSRNEIKAGDIDTTINNNSYKTINSSSSKEKGKAKVLSERQIVEYNSNNEDHDQNMIYEKFKGNNILYTQELGGCSSSTYDKSNKGSIEGEGDINPNSKNKVITCEDQLNDGNNCTNNNFSVEKSSLEKNSLIDKSLYSKIPIKKFASETSITSTTTTTTTTNTSSNSTLYSKKNNYLRRVKLNKNHQNNYYTNKFISSFSNIRKFSNEKLTNLMKKSHLYSNFNSNINAINSNLYQRSDSLVISKIRQTSLIIKNRKNKDIKRTRTNESQDKIKGKMIQENTIETPNSGSSSIDLEKASRLSNQSRKSNNNEEDVHIHSTISNDKDQSLNSEKINNSVHSQVDNNIVGSDSKSVLSNNNNNSLNPGLIPDNDNSDLNQNTLTQNSYNDQEQRGSNQTVANNSFNSLNNKYDKKGENEESMFFESKNVSDNESYTKEEIKIQINKNNFFQNSDTNYESQFSLTEIQNEVDKKNQQKDSILKVTQTKKKELNSWQNYDDFSPASSTVSTTNKSKDNNSLISLPPYMIEMQYYNMREEEEEKEDIDEGNVVIITEGSDDDDEDDDEDEDEDGINSSSKKENKINNHQRNQIIKGKGKLIHESPTSLLTSSSSIIDDGYDSENENENESESESDSEHTISQDEGDNYQYENNNNKRRYMIIDKDNEKSNNTIFNESDDQIKVHTIFNESDDQIKVHTIFNESDDQIKVHTIFNESDDQIKVHTIFNESDDQIKVQRDDEDSNSHNKKSDTMAKINKTNEPLFKEEEMKNNTINKATQSFNNELDYDVQAEQSNKDKEDNDNDKLFFNNRKSYLSQEEEIKNNETEDQIVTDDKNKNIKDCDKIKQKEKEKNNPGNRNLERNENINSQQTLEINNFSLNDDSEIMDSTDEPVVPVEKSHKKNKKITYSKETTLRKGYLDDNDILSKKPIIPGKSRVPKPFKIYVQKSLSTQTMESQSTVYFDCS